MRMSCNGCRVLRKGCSEDCSIRPCLQWIKSPEAQGNATVFLAKFYGRAGLLNLVNAGPEHLRPAIFRSLLYEACGRVVNPIYGSVGLLWSGSWHLCQAAVDNVLKGAPVTQISTEAAAATGSPLRSFDIRHVPKGGGEDLTAAGATSSPANELHKVAKAGRTRFKRPGTAARREGGGGTEIVEVRREIVEVRREKEEEDVKPSYLAQSRESTGSHQGENESMVSEETAEEGSMVTSHGGGVDDGDVHLELTLGFAPTKTSSSTTPAKRCDVAGGDFFADGETCTVDLALDLSAR